jgi:hypothetical protein
MGACSEKMLEIFVSSVLKYRLRRKKALQAALPAQCRRAAIAIFA